MKNRLFSKFVAKSHVGSRLTDEELDVIKRADIDEMAATFIKVDSKIYMAQIQSALKSLKCFLGDEIELRGVLKKSCITGDYIAGQHMDGDIDVFLGITGQKGALLEVASLFADSNFTELDEDAYDALCELINCVNGSFAAWLCDEKIEVVLHPPVFFDDADINAAKDIYVVEFGIKDEIFDIIMAIDSNVDIKRATAV